MRGFVLGETAVTTQVLTDESPDFLSIGDFALVLYDREGQLAIDHILDRDTLGFHKAGKDFGSDFEFPAVVWAKIHIHNAQNHSVLRYLKLCDRADTIHVYKVLDNELIGESQSGYFVKPLDRDVPSSHYFTNISLDPGQEKTFYVRSVFNRSVGNIHYSHFYLQDAQNALQNFTIRLGIQFFYFGTMLTLSILGFILFLVFRDRSFGYFGLLGLFFSIYFTFLGNAFQTLVWHVHFSYSMWISTGSIMGLIIMGFLLISNHISMKSHFPRLYRFFMGLTALAVIFRIVAYFIWSHDFMSTFIFNLLLVCWIITAMIPVTILTLRKNKEGIQMFLGLSIMFLSFLVLIVGMIRFESWNIWVLSSVQIGTILFYILLFVGMINKVQGIKQERLEATSLSKLKSRFFANISHEFRTPLTMIMGPIDYVLESKGQSDESVSMLSAAKKHAQRLLVMVNELLELSKLDSKSVKLALVKKDIVAFLRGLVMSFGSLAEIRNIELSVEGEKEAIPLWFDPAKMEVIFTNLLSNAFKFTSEGGKISVVIKRSEKSVEISVSDTGIGIPASELPYIFDRFFQSEEVEKQGIASSGIGLSLAKEYTDLHGGTIEAVSTEGKGTRLILKFATGKAHFRSKDVAFRGEEEVITEEWKTEIESLENKVDLDNSLDEVSSITLANITDQKPTLLVVEDNSDVRRFIMDQFEDQFNVMEAENGEKGIKMANLHHPELIISDAMMPVLDGFELCKTLKSDLNTSHIPIILLTARSEMEQKIKGLELGADDYITKPFNSRELKVRVRNLIELRIELRKKILETPSFSYQSTKLSPLDSKFLEKVDECIHRNISDRQFGVTDLAGEFILNQTQLNRKLKSLTELTAGKYIQHVRLNKALLMLQQKEGNVSEVALRTGFSSNAYFIKCFKDKFGATPGSIVE